MREDQIPLSKEELLDRIPLHLYNQIEASCYGRYSVLERLFNAGAAPTGGKSVEAVQEARRILGLTTLIKKRLDIETFIKEFKKIKHLKPVIV